MPQPTLGVDLEMMTKTTRNVQIFTHVGGDTFIHRHVLEPDQLGASDFVQTEIVATGGQGEMVYELRSATLDEGDHAYTIFFVIERNKESGVDLIGEKMRMALNTRGAYFITAFRAASWLEQFRLLGYR